MNKKPLTKKKVIRLLQRLKRINLEEEKIKLLDAEDRILSESIISDIDLPPFKNSAVDGFAIHKDDVGKEKVLKLKFRIAAGENKKIILSKGEVA